LLLSNKDYLALSEKYVKEALKSGSLFELNTGAISRGYRKSPYPYENLLHIIEKEGGGIILSSDSHDVSTLDFYFEESKKILKDIGFSCIYTLSGGEFIKEGLIL
jgi:histidinol-phosphatase (PHP family)